MRFLLVLPTVLLLTACMNDPEPKGSDAAIANTQIQENKTEAKIAQEEYIRLQKERDAQ
ncbi:hypothetical protein PGH07_10655 [Sulfurovum sp. zt1-1]|uniref:Lipoprotein n=1 Tax=Sulfurovum zhangzhouensis TaxID=3019067 RepID=A0ABT7R260_9BACT|nr:hypothetical protein [Sulfurovum zhangzhouensis]MDM5272631.1 hypothetical protein [Sulfurovum zhangzhouensis]